MPDNKLEQIANVLFKNISYYAITHKNNDGMISIRLTTKCDDAKHYSGGLWNNIKGTGKDVESAKRVACQGLAKRIIDNE